MAPDELPPFRHRGVLSRLRGTRLPGVRPRSGSSPPAVRRRHLRRRVRLARPSSCPRRTRVNVPTGAFAATVPSGAGDIDRRTEPGTFGELDRWRRPGASVVPGSLGFGTDPTSTEGLDPETDCRPAASHRDAVESCRTVPPVSTATPIRAVTGRSMTREYDSVSRFRSTPSEDEPPVGRVGGTSLVPIDSLPEPPRIELYNTRRQEPDDAASGSDDKRGAVGDSRTTAITPPRCSGRTLPENGRGYIGRTYYTEYNHSGGRTITLLSAGGFAARPYGPRAVHDHGRSDENDAVASRAPARRPRARRSAGERTRCGARTARERRSEGAESYPALDARHDEVPRFVIHRGRRVLDGASSPIPGRLR